MKIMSVFVDTSAWIAIIDEENEFHTEAVEYFTYLLSSKITIVTNNMVLDETIDQLKINFGVDTAKKFNEIINESIINVKLRMDWISRRERKLALDSFLKDKSSELSLRYFYIAGTVKRKKVDILFTLDKELAHLGLPIMPQKNTGA
jgi:predicted nucleic acid-binding protein